MDLNPDSTGSVYPDPVCRNEPRQKNAMHEKLDVLLGLILEALLGASKRSKINFFRLQICPIFLFESGSTTGKVTVPTKTENPLQVHIHEQRQHFRYNPRKYAH
jgi:hypothetical protein